MKSAYAAFEQGALAEVVYQPSSLPSNQGPLRSTAPSAETDLIVLYSAMIRGLKRETTAFYISAADFLASKVHWAINVAEDEFQLRLVLDLICAFVNKRVDEMGDALSSLLESIWAKHIQDTEQPFEIRRRGLLVYMHVSQLLQTALTTDRKGPCSHPQRPGVHGYPACRRHS